MTDSQIQDLEDCSYLHGKLRSEDQSAFTRYKGLVIGEKSWWELLKYELITTLFGPIPGALGLALRKIFYPMLFQQIGKGVVFGKNVVIRHPDKIRIGRGTMIDEASLIDAHGAGEEGVVIKENVTIGRNCVIHSKSGPIEIGEKSSIGAYSLVVSMGGVKIGDHVLIAGGCQISGGINHTGRLDIPIAQQGMYTRGPIVIGKDVRFGMSAMVLDAANIGTGCVIGPGAVVRQEIPEFTIVTPHQRLVMVKREPGE